MSDLERAEVRVAVQPVAGQPWRDMCRWACFRCERITRRRHVDVFGPCLTNGTRQWRDRHGRFVFCEPGIFCSGACRRASAVEGLG